MMVVVIGAGVVNALDGADTGVGAELSWLLRMDAVVVAAASFLLVAVLVNVLVTAGLEDKTGVLSAEV